MTVNTNARAQYYTGNGVTDTFAVNFQFYQLSVYVDGTLKAQGVDYVLKDTNGIVIPDGAGNAASVVFQPGSIPVGGLQIALLGDTTIDQAVDYRNFDDAPGDLFEKSLDKLAMIARERYERSLRLSPQSNGVSAQLPKPFGGSALAWSDDGLSLVNKTLPTVIIPIGGTFIISATAPSSPTPGMVWLDSSSGIEYLYFNDGNSSQWVEFGAGFNGQQGTAGTNGAGANPNLLYNSDGRVDQRANGAVATTNDDAYGSSDRWYSLTQTASITVQRLTNGESGTPFYQQLKQTQASAQRMGRAQIIDGASCKHARGASVTLSARFRISNSQVIRYAVLEWVGTEDSVTSDVVNDWTNGTFTGGNFFVAANLNVLGVGTITPSANTWTSITPLTVTGGASLNNLIVFVWTEGTAAQNVTLDISRMKLEVSGTATPWEPPATDREILRCRYFFRDIIRGAASGNFTPPVWGAKTGAALIDFPISFGTPMRVAPTLSHNVAGYQNSSPSTTANVAIFNATAAAFFAITGALTIAITGAANPTIDGCVLRFTAGTSWDGSTGNLAQLFVGTANISLDAEL